MTLTGRTGEGWVSLAQNSSSQRLPRAREVWKLSLCDSGGSHPCVPVFTYGDDAVCPHVY